MTIYTGSRDKVKIICPIHGVFEQRAANHLRGEGCVRCAGRRPRLSRTDWVNLFEDIHGAKYEYHLLPEKMVYNEKVTIVCPEHGHFVQEPRSHLYQESGCPECNRGKQKLTSRPCQNWLNDLCVPIREWRIPDTKFTADGYDPETNTVFEFLGSYWHGDPQSTRFKTNDIHPVIGKTYGELYEKTLNKLDAIEKLGYTVVHI